MDVSKNDKYQNFSPKLQVRQLKILFLYYDQSRGSLVFSFQRQFVQIIVGLPVYDP